MSRGPDLSIGQRVGYGFGAVGALLAVFLLVTGLVGRQVVELRRERIERIEPRVQAAVRLEVAALHLGLSARACASFPDLPRREDFEGSRLRLREALAQLESLPGTPQGESMLLRLPGLVDRFEAAGAELAEAAFAGRTAELIHREREMTVVREELVDTIRSFRALQEGRSRQVTARISAAERRLQHMAAGFIAAIFGILAVTGWLTVHSVRRPAGQLVDATRRLADGDFDTAVALLQPPRPARSAAAGDAGGLAPAGEVARFRDELAELSRAFARMALELRARDERLHALHRELQDRNERLERQNQLLQAQQEALQEKNGLLRIQQEALQQQNEELQVQQEKLQQQNEEMQAQREELQQQNEELQAQREELQAQHEELHAHRERMGATLEQLRRSEERQRDEARKKDEFLALLSHELRNPLAAIQNSLFVLAAVEPGGEQARQARGIIERQSRQLTRLVDDLLDISRITHGRIELRQSPVDLAQLVRQVAEDNRQLFDAAGVSLETVLPVAPLGMTGDPTRLGQMVFNLLQNAVKYTPSGGSVRLAVEPAGSDRVMLRVRDTGTGIEPELLPRLFEPFVQGRGAPAHFAGGLGLGLALVQGLAELHGGSVSVASEGKGKGAEFTVDLPLGGERAGTVAAAATPSPPRVRRRVLIVEDNADAAASLAQALRLSGHLVEVARDGRDGVSKARRDCPDLILCDIGLPDTDGYAVAREIRAAEGLERVCLVALTGFGRPSDRERAAQAGFQAHLTKPVSLVELEEVLDRLFNEEQQRDPAV